LPIRGLKNSEEGRDMKINPEISSVINLIKKDGDYYKKTEDKTEDQRKVADIVSVENSAASGSQVENVEQARALLTDVMNGMGKSSSSVHNLNQYRISQLIS
jgi:hypothetical protein